MTTVRFYLPSSGAAAVSPAYGALWDDTVEADRRPMSTTPSNTANASAASGENVAATADYLIRQYVGPNDLAAGALTGTMRLIVPCEESNVDANMWLQARVAVVSSDGSTERGELFAGQSQGSASATSTDPNYEFSQTPTRRTRILEVALSEVTAQANDRLVVELGYRFNNSGTTTRGGTLHFGDETADTDYAFTVDLALDAGKRPWVEFDFTPAVTDVSLEAGVMSMAWSMPTADIGGDAALNVPRVRHPKALITPNRARARIMPRPHATIVNPEPEAHL